MKNIKGLIIDHLHPIVEEKLKNHMTIDKCILPTQEELVEKIKEYNVLIMRVDPKINKEIVDAGKELKIIGVGSVGLNHIDLDYAKEKNIIVRNVPGVNFEAVAELTIGNMISLMRQSYRACPDVKDKGIWDKYRYLGYELKGKTLGLVALGRIGSRVAEMAKVIGMDILAYDPFLNEEQAKERGAKLVSFEELVKESDVISVHAPLTESTRDMFSTEEFKKMKDSSFLLNMARGGVVNEKALYEALSSNKIAGASVDVMEFEPCTSSPLYSLDNFMVTPHIGGQTEEAQREIGSILVDNVIESLKEI